MSGTRLTTRCETGQTNLRSRRGICMRITFRPGAIAATAAGGLAVAGLGTTAPALAAPITVNVPCSATALAGAISGAVGGDVLQLAGNCTYLLSSALPQVTVGLTIQGSPTSTIEWGYPGSFPLLWVGTSDGLTVSHVNFKDGDAPYGGAIYGKSGPVTVNGGTFSGNTATTEGGAIDNDDGLTVTGATFSGNSAESGGAIGSEDTSSVQNSTFTGNTGTYGGALYNHGDATVSNSTFTGNSTGTYGGAIEVVGPGISTLNKDSFTKNSAEYGGGIEVEGGTLHVNTGYFQQNTATDEGGGVSNYGRMTLDNTTFNANNVGGTAAASTTLARRP